MRRKIIARPKERCHAVRDHEENGLAAARSLQSAKGKFRKHTPVTGTACLAVVLPSVGHNLIQNALDCDPILLRVVQENARTEGSQLRR